VGSFLFAGTVTTNERGDTFHGDHGYAQYFVPSKAREYPLVMWHGLGQSAKTWESTPDGREGFWQIFMRRGWPVYILEQPRRGRAGNTLAVDSKPSNIPNLVSESASWEVFRLGHWSPPEEPTYFTNVQFPRDPASIDQFFGQAVPNSGAEPFPSAEHREFMANAVAGLLQRTGPAILLTHSHSGQYGWVTAMKAPGAVRAIVAYEPGEFAFPLNEIPAEIPTDNPLLASFMAPQLVAPAEFLELTRFPILVVYGDNISTQPSPAFGVELWRLAKARARQFVAAVNRHGGDARLIDLPQIGICGNTHFPFSDLNNVRIADQLSEFLHGKGLDGRAHAYLGPN
jgi:pimeloyl-ACP methyl ester carboxylesterase